MTAELRAEGMELPIVYRMYYNTVLHGGVSAFVENCAVAGVDGLLILDLPPEEQGELQESLGETDATILIRTVSYASGKRIPGILDGARGYVRNITPVAAQGHISEENIKSYLNKLEAMAKIPVVTE